jgi:hypothetical protein
MTMETGPMSQDGPHPISFMTMETGPMSHRRPHLLYDNGDRANVTQTGLTPSPL